jgi:RHH-type transcriptional regulator, rel operon repressor / antitoxin RelB
MALDEGAEKKGGSLPLSRKDVWISLVPLKRKSQQKRERFHCSLQKVCLQLWFRFAIHVSQFMRIAMVVSLRLPEDLAMRLDKLAKRTGRTKTYYMIEAIREQIGDLEDLYLAERELAEIRAGRSKTTPLAQVLKDYGLGD